jgi:serine/threonine-protein kinase
MDKISQASTLPAPSASVTYGAAGLAYGLMRLARTREDGELLALADLWSVRAGARARDKSAFYNAELEINPETVGRSSPYHTMSGVHWVRASVAQAINDAVGFNQACDDLVRASQERVDDARPSVGDSKESQRRLFGNGRQLPQMIIQRRRNPVTSRSHR